MCVTDSKKSVQIVFMRHFQEVFIYVRHWHGMDIHKLQESFNSFGVKIFDNERFRSAFLTIVA